MVYFGRLFEFKVQPPKNANAPLCARPNQQCPGPLRAYKRTALKHYKHTHLTTRIHSHSHPTH